MGNVEIVETCLSKLSLVNRYGSAAAKGSSSLEFSGVGRTILEANNVLIMVQYKFNGGADYYRRQNLKKRYHGVVL